MEAKFMTIDHIPVEIEGEKNILSVIRKRGIDLPTFCYYSELSIQGACRMCMVEDEERGSLMAACSTPPASTGKISWSSCWPTIAVTAPPAPRAAAAACRSWLTASASARCASPLTTTRAPRTLPLIPLSVTHPSAYYAGTACACVPRCRISVS